MKSIVVSILFASIATVFGVVWAKRSATPTTNAKTTEEKRADPVESQSSKESKIASGHNLLLNDSATGLPADSLIENFSFRDINGKPYYLHQTLKKGPAVFVFMSSKCPLALRYTSRLKEMHQEFSEKGVTLFAVFPNCDDTLEKITDFCDEKAKYPFASVQDLDGFVTRKLGARMTPQAFLIDRQAKLRYRGKIDDHRIENRVKHHYLADAIDSVLADKPVKEPVTDAMGCTIHLAEDEEAQITYSGHIARIIQNNCMSCHREGQVADFPLVNYDDAKRWRNEIKAYTQERLMPPWKASHGVAEYKNDTSLTNAEISLISKWVDQGAPRGNPDKIPAPPKFDDGWAFGEPDLVVEMPEEYVIDAQGEDDYRHFVIPYEAVQDKFITAVDVQAGNRKVVHHVLAYFDANGVARKLDAAAEGPGYSRFGDIGFKPTSLLGGWAPGKVPTRLPVGSGLWLPKKGDIVLQVHYYRTGFVEKDKTRIGFYFSKHARTVPARTAVVQNKKFIIPAGKDKVQVIAKHTLKQDSYVYSVTPHMHLVGKKLTVLARRPDGKSTTLVRIDNWDFNWQLAYYLKEPKEFPKGTEFEMIATFDNSANNPNNPHSPPQDIKYGEKTTDEMCVSFIGHLHKSEYDPWKKAAAAAIAQRKAEQ